MLPSCRNLYARIGFLSIEREEGMNSKGILIMAVMQLAQPGSAGDIDLFLFCGQSNAHGYKGDAAYYPEDTKHLDSKIPFYYVAPPLGKDGGGDSGGKWITLGPQKFGRYKAGNFGPEITFARALYNAGYKPAIFKYSKGATSLAGAWRAPDKKGLYDQMAAEFARAKTLLEEQGHTVTVRAFVWIQGESDGKYEETAAAYYDSLKLMIHHLRTEVIKDEKLPFILGLDEQNVKFPQVIEAQQHIAAEDPAIIFTSMKGLPKADHTHLNPAGLALHGERLFEAYQKIAE